MNFFQSSFRTATRSFCQTARRLQVKEVTSQDHFKLLISSDKVAIVDFYATWCGPCKAIEPVMEKLSEMAPEAEFLRVDVDQQTDIAEEYGITAMPTIKFYRDAVPVDTVIGANLGKIVSLLKEHTGVDVQKK